MGTEAQVYDFESALETAVKAVFTALDITCFIPSDDPTFQRNLPRVELQVLTGPASGHLQPVTFDSVASRLVYDAWDAVLMIDCYTKANHAEHVGYRAAIRAAASRIIYLATLDYHEIHDVTPAGTSPTLKPEDGSYQTRLQYTLKFCVKHTEWPVT